MRDAEKLLLDDHLHRVIMKHIGTLQSWFRAVLARRRYLKLRLGVVRMQAWVRGIQARSEVRRQHLAAVLIQSCWRRWRAERHFRRVRAAALAVQCWFRARQARMQLERLRAEHPQRPRPAISFDIDKVHKVALPTFNLNDPDSLARFARSGSASDEETIEQLSSISDEEADKWDASDIDLDATFILEDTRLKLVG